MNTSQVNGTNEEFSSEDHESLYESLKRALRRLIPDSILDLGDTIPDFNPKLEYLWNRLSELYEVEAGPGSPGSWHARFRLHQALNLTPPDSPHWCSSEIPPGNSGTGFDCATKEDLAFASLLQISNYIRDRQLSVRSVTDLMLNRISEINPIVHAYISLGERERLLEEAEALDRELKVGTCRSRLHGVPLGVKDTIDLKGFPTTAGSRALDQCTVSKDAHAVARLRAHGAIFLGKHALAEFGHGDHERFPRPLNPWNLELSPGESSSGSAAAVSAGLCYGALGTDGGGSVRVPASYCGLVGLKPTFGLVSGQGAGHCNSIGHVGILSRTVDDAAAILSIVAGYDSSYPNSVAVDTPDYCRVQIRPNSEITVGIPWGWIDNVSMDTEVRQVFEMSLQALEQEGMSLSPVTVRFASYSQIATFTILKVEHFANHRRLMQKRGHLYGASARTKNLQGAFIPASCYMEAQQIRNAVTAEFSEVFKWVDAIVTPTTPVTAGPPAECTGSAPDLTYGPSHFTAAFNLSGNPAVSVPCGYSRSGLPIGFQIVCRPFEEVTLLHIARTLERALALKANKPNLR